MERTIPKKGDTNFTGPCMQSSGTACYGKNKGNGCVAMVTNCILRFLKLAGYFYTCCLIASSLLFNVALKNYLQCCRHKCVIIHFC
jgi:hypothetical protein